MHDVESIHVFPHHGNSRVNYDQISKDHNIPVYYYDRDGTGLTKEEFHTHFPDNKFEYKHDLENKTPEETRIPINTGLKTNYKTELGDEIRF